MDIKIKRGFASMTPERVREVAASGGRAAHEQGTAHRYTREEARLAGSKGGKARALNVKNRNAATAH